MRHGMTRLVAFALLTAAAACAQQQPSDSSNDVPLMAARASDTPQAVTRYRAITHRFGLRLPAREVEATQQKHLAECARLGCTVLSTRIDRQQEGRISAQLSIRIAPEAYSDFAGVLAAPPVTITSQAQTSEDKTLPILDAEKRLEVKVALRDRLNAMLRDPGPKSAADLAAIEKEIAQAQADIESLTAQRDTLRTQTDTIRVEISYTGVTAQAGGWDLSPIQSSLRGISQTVVSSIAWLISFLAAALPWIPLIGVVWWTARRIIRRRRARQQP